MNLVKASNENILEAARVLKEGGLVAFPTETVYGLGADGLNPIAAAKIFEVKERPSFNPLILHISHIDQFKSLSDISISQVEDIINNFWPGPLTLVVPKKDIVPEIITSGHPSVAIRMPDHEVALNLITKAETPVAAPSANKFSQLSPTKANHVKKQLGDEIDMILDGGPCKIGVESTILRVTEKGYELLRPGGIDLEKIESIVGKVKIVPAQISSPVAPGMLPFHYAPNIPLDFLTKESLKRYRDKKIGALLFRENNFDFEFEFQKILSAEGNLHETSANLFAYLHEMENKNLDIILVERIPEEGLGRAIMDRLNKAAAKYV